MKVYSIIRDIIFFILGLAILGVGIYTAKMTNVIDSNLIYVNRKVPPTEMEQNNDKHLQQNFVAEPTEIDNEGGYNE